MATSIVDIVPGDFVKVAPNRYKEVASVYGVIDGRPAKPSEGFFGVRTTDGADVSGWQALAYVKRQDLPDVITD